MIKTITLAVVSLALLVVAGCGNIVTEEPTGLTVTSTAPIALSWNGVAPASTNYNVYRGTASGILSTKTLLASNINVTTYTDTSAVSGTTYYYQVTAVTAGGESAGSLEVSATAQ